MVFPMESPTDYFRRWQCHVTVRLSQFESLDHSVGKIVWRHHAVAYFQTNCVPRWRNGRYIPMEYFLSVYTDRFADGLRPSVYTDRCWDGIMFVDNYYRRNVFVGNSVGFLRFSGSGSNKFTSNKSIQNQTGSQSRQCQASVTPNTKQDCRFQPYRQELWRTKWTCK